MVTTYIYWINLSFRSKHSVKVKDVRVEIPTDRDCCVWKGTNWPGGGKWGGWWGERWGGCKRNGSLEIRGGNAAYGTGKCWTEHAWSICKRNNYFLLKVLEYIINF